MFAAAFPKWDLAGLAWFAPALLLLVTAGQSGKMAFRCGFVTGLSFYLMGLSWLLNIPVTFFPILGWLALSAYLSLYTGLWAWLCWKLFPVTLKSETGPGSLSRLAGDFLNTTLGQRLRWALSCAVLWVALEMVMGRFLSGFPWLLLGISQSKILPLIQIASWTGVYGVSFLMVWLSASLAGAVFTIIHRPARYWNWIMELLLPLVVVMLVIFLGFREVAFSHPPGERTLKVVLVQPSIPQKMKWNEEENRKAFSQVIQLSESALLLKPDLLVWPEAATPGYLRYDREIGDVVTGLAEKHHVWMILGADDAEPIKGSADPKAANFFNSAFLITPQGELARKYDKRKLVAFGEYVPLIRWLPFIKYFTPIDGGFTPGERPAVFRMVKPEAAIAPLICFEDVFGDLAREYVSEDTDFLLNLTNDGWFGESAAQWQHNAQSVFRAVENRITVVRSTNNGLTCWVDAQGRLHEVYFGNSPDVYGPGFKTAQIPLLGKEERRTLTFYTRHGDVFGWICVVLAVLVLGCQWRSSRPKKA